MTKLTVQQAVALWRQGKPLPPGAVIECDPSKTQLVSEAYRLYLANQHT